MFLPQRRFSTVANTQPQKLACSGAFILSLSEFFIIKRTKGSRKFV